MNARIRLIALLCFLLTAGTAAGAQDAPSPAEAPEAKLVYTLEGHTDGVVDVACFPDGHRIVSGSHDRTLRVWDLRTGKELRRFEGQLGPVWAVAVSADGRRVASGSSDHTARVWDVETGEQVAQLEGHTGEVRGVAFLPDGKLMTGGGDGSIRLWDVDAEKQLWKQPVFGSIPVGLLAVSADGRRAACCPLYASSMSVWDVPG